MHDFITFKKLKEQSNKKIIPILNEAAFTNKNNIIISRSKNKILLTSVKNEINKEIKRLNLCGYSIKIYKCKECGKWHFSSFHACKSKFCPNCTKLKSSIWTARIMQEAKDWLDNDNYIFTANFTIKDQYNLNDGLDILNTAWRNLINGTKYRQDVKDLFKGGLKSLEIKLGKNSHIWHPHLHTLIFKDNFSKDYNFLKEAWAHSCELAGLPRTINGKNTNSVYLHGFDKKTKEKDLLSNIKEVTKYILKYSNITPEEITDIYLSTKGIKQLTSFGMLRGLQKQVEKDEDEENSNKAFVCENCNCTKYDSFDLDINDEKLIEDLPTVKSKFYLNKI